MWSGRSRLVVVGSAIVAVLLRVWGLFEPLHADEAGFLMVARTWHPRPASLYGHFFLDRPPPVVALFKLSDAVGGPYFIRVLGALACLAFVLLAAMTAWEVSRDKRTVQLTAVVAAALIGNAGIDPYSTKGELLGTPWIMAGCLLFILTVRRNRVLLAAVAGFVAMVPMGLKQSMAGALVFGALLLLASAAFGTISRRRCAALAAGALVGASMPVLATVGWALSAGVHLERLWFATFGFRMAANTLIADGPILSVAARFVGLVLLGVGIGIAIVVGAFAKTARLQWHRDRALVVATVGMLVVDLTGVFLGGNFWGAYLFQLLPPVLMALIGVLAAGRLGTRGRRLVVGWPVVASAIAALVVTGLTLVHPWPRTPYNTGLAIRAVAQPGDSIVVYNGNAQVAFASGLWDPYFLWSLPTRVLDPRLHHLRTLLNGPEAPTWMVVPSNVDAFGIDDGTVPSINRQLRARYVNLGPVCGLDTWRLRTVQRDRPIYDCHRPWRPW